MNKYKVLVLSLITFIFLHTSCIKENISISNFSLNSSGVLILNEGQMSKANSSISFYNPKEKTVINDLFYKANGVPLGDVAQSIYDANNLYYIMLTNSRKIIAVDKKSFKQIKTISQGLVEPRYMLKAENKLYVSNLKGKNIAVFDNNLELLKNINTNIINSQDRYSPDSMILANNKIFVSCNFNDRSILVIDPKTDTIEHTIEVGITPSSMIVDTNNKLWVLCTGGYDGHPIGKEDPTLYVINPTNYSVEKKIPFKNNHISSITVNKHLDTLYLLNNNSVMKLPITASIETEALEVIKIGESNYLYSLFVDTENNEIYLTDPKNYINRGIIYRYNLNGEQLDSFEAGIIPAFMMNTSL